MRPIKSSLHHKISPLSTTGTGPHPALILLHGRGSNEEDLLGLVPFLDPRLFVVSVRAPLVFPYGGYTWYTMAEVGQPDPAEFMESHGRLEQFLNDVRASYPVDPERILLLGFSMGSVMSLGLALTHPADIRGVIAHSGYVPEASPLTFLWDRIGHCRFFVAHGVEDPVIPVRFGRRAKALLTEKGADLMYREYPIGHHVSEESLSDGARWLTGLLEGGPGS
jgi:phospholipase/carboxylesterase